ncbi:MAG: hypothetical protein ABH817_00295 [archaeon]
MKLLLITLLFLTLFISGCITEEIKECYSDSDCIKTQISCCPCFKGGEEACVPISLQALCQDNIEKKCEPGDIYCAGENSCRIKNCLCQNNKCTAIIKNEIET